MWLQGDSGIAVTWINSGLMSPMRHLPWLKHLAMWGLLFSSFKVWHICREGNQAADWLASHSVDGDFCIRPGDQIHPELAYILNADASHITYPRHAS